MAASNDLQQTLKPFHERASNAEDRLARLEAAFAAMNVEREHVDSGDGDLRNKVAELQRKLEDVKAEQLSEREKALQEVERLSVENAKLRYRIIHLIRALQQADRDLESKGSEAC